MLLDVLSNLAQISYTPWLSLSWLWVCLNEAMKNSNVKRTNV